MCENHRKQRYFSSNFYFTTKKKRERERSLEISNYLPPVTQLENDRAKN